MIAALAMVESGLMVAGVMTGAPQWLQIAAASSVIWGVVTMVCTAHVLSQRGVRINYPLFGLLMVFEYLPRYRALTLQEAGRVGPLYYSYILAMNLALAAVILLLTIQLG